MKYMTLGRNFLVLSCLALTWGVGQTVDGGSVVTGLPNNALSAQEQTDGYALIWNGTDYTGWLVNNSQTNPSTPTSVNSWTIWNGQGSETGTKHASANPDSNFLEVNSTSTYSMFTIDTTFENFDWKVEWQAAVNTSNNSGLIFHYRLSSGTVNDNSATEYQLCNAEWTSEWKTLTETAGCDYDMLPMLPSRRNPDLSPSWVRAEGHWNQSRIITYGAHVAFYGNGLRLLEYQMLTPAWNAAYQASKYPAYGGIYNTVHEGSLYLQAHGQPYVKFRNIRVKRLTQNPWSATAPCLGPTTPCLNADSAAKGDSTLIDSLTFAQDLFPVATAISPYTIVPKYATKIVANRDGLLIEFSQPGNYTLSLEDVRGVRFSVHSVHNSSQFYLPGQFSNSPRILTIWKDDKKIQEGIIGTK